MKSFVKTAETQLPTVHGVFSFMVFQDENLREHVALVKGNLSSASPVLCRIHSECLTGEVFGSIKCDCKQQLDDSLKAIGASGCGVLIYLRQEGRGIGLTNKIKAYALQEKGLDTVDANLKLGFPDDVRDYRVASEILRLLSVTSIDLMTNNPQKVKSMKQAGIQVTRCGHKIQPISKQAADYIDVKKTKMGHFDS